MVRATRGAGSTGVKQSLLPRASLQLKVITYGSSKCHDALGHLWDVPSLPQINRLENVSFRNSESFGRVLEMIQVFHELEVSAGRVDFGDGSGRQLVHQPASRTTD